MEAYSHRDDHTGRGDERTCNVDHPDTETQKLKGDTIGPWGLAALAIGITSPAMGLYALWGPMQVAAGPITPLIFLAAMVVTLPTAISYALLNQHAPSAGAASNWLWISVSPLAGLLAGLFMTTYFFMAAVAQPLMFALFFQDLLKWLNIDLRESAAVPIGTVIATAPLVWICLGGAETSIKSTVRLMVIETAVVVALSVTILVAKSAQTGAINLAPFDPRLSSGLSGFWTAMILGVLAFCGFDVVSTAAEEARAPRETLPKAILLTVVGIAIFWAFNAWAFTLSTPDLLVRQYTARGLTAVTPMAKAYWGWANLVVIATAFTGITAVYISCVQGTSRIIFALARHRLLPKSLAHLSGEKRVPRNAIIVILILVLSLDFLSLIFLQNGLDSFTWWANALVFFATLTFMAVNAANIAYFWRLKRPHFSFFKNLFLPVLGIAFNAYLIYAAFFSALWAADMKTGKSVVLACCGLLIAQLIAGITVATLRPQLLARSAPLGTD